MTDNHDDVNERVFDYTLTAAELNLLPAWGNLRGCDSVDASRDPVVFTRRGMLAAEMRKDQLLAELGFDVVAGDLTLEDVRIDGLNIVFTIYAY